MAIIEAHKYLNLAEVNKREGYDDAAAVLGELMQVNEFLDEVPWFPSSHGSFNKQLQASILGKGAFTKPNGTIPTISSKADPITEPVKLYAADSPVDEQVLAGADDPYLARDSEDAMNLEGIMQDWNYQLIYAASDPDAFVSLSRRRNAIGDYCLDGGGSGSDLTSMLIFEFGRSAFHMIFNKAGSPGLKNEDRGRHSIPAPDGDGNYWAWLRHYEIWAGIVLRNQGAFLRYANLETDPGATTSTFDPVQFIKLTRKLPRLGRNAVAFGNRTLSGQIMAEAYDRTNIQYSIREIVGFGPIPAVAGIPVRTWEAIIDTESEVA